MSMTATQLIGWVNAAEILIQLGSATKDEITAFIRSKYGAGVEPMTDDELNTICDYVVNDATRRKAMADADAVSTEQPGGVPAAAVAPAAAGNPG